MTYPLFLWNLLNTSKVTFLTINKSVGAILPPNPSTTRAFPLSQSIHPSQKVVAYPCKNNVIIRDLENPSKSLIYTGSLNKVTAVQYSPDGSTLAVGLDNGKVVLVYYSENKKEFIQKVEHVMLMGEVNGLCFNEDGSKIVAVG